jgi:hypothetical protein
MSNAERIQNIKNELSAIDDYLKLCFNEDFGGYIIPQQISEMIINLMNELDRLTAEGQTE